MGQQHFTEKAISLQVYAQSSCWGTATNHPCQTNPTQKVMGPGPALLTPCFPWEKQPLEPQERERIRDRGFCPHLWSPPPRPHPPPHIKTQDTHLRGQGPLGMTSPLFTATGSEFLNPAHL